MSFPSDWRRLLMAFALGMTLTNTLPKALEKGSMGAIIALMP